MRAAVAQPREIARLLAVGELDLLLGIQSRGERCGVRLLPALAQMAEGEIEHREDLRRIRFGGRRAGALEARPEMQRVSEADEKIGGEHHPRNDRRF